MSIDPDPTTLDEQAKRDFSSGRYDAALTKFRQAADAYAALGDRTNTAEQMNNMGVTLLQLGRAQEALDSVTGTDAVFAAAGDMRRQGISLNNQAAALEALQQADAAIAAYERAAQLLGEAGEGGLKSESLKAAAAIDLRRGRLASSGSNMLGALGSNPNPNPVERALRALLRLIR